MRKLIILVCATFLLSLFYSSNIDAQKRKNIAPVSNSIDESLYNNLKWRNIGPWRGGRSAAVTGVPGHPNLYYFGAAGGGIFKTMDGGRSWENISDGFFGGSVGSIAVSESDQNVLYVGGGEVTVRGNVSSGWRMEKRRCW